MIRNVVIGVAIASVWATDANATRWVRVAETADAVRSIDADAVIRAGSIVTIWLKTEYSRKGERGETLALEKWMHDCANDRAKLLALTLYRSDGRVVGSAQLPRYRQEWDAIVPSSVGERVHQRVCGIDDADQDVEAKALDAMPPNDPAGSTPGCRSKDEDEEYAQLVLGLAVGFCIGGYVLPDRQPSAYVVIFEPLKPKPTAEAVQMDGYGFWGAPNMVSRLLHGTDWRLKDEILNSGHWSGQPADLDAILIRFVLGGLRLPIRDAIDFVYSYIFSTIKAFKFSSMPQICGGPIELAVIRRDRLFQWVRHKPWHAALEEGAIK